jgi:16S rRNA (uracil1498-N3)-methyltransferase
VAVSLGEGVARHAHVLRLGLGAPVHLIDGAGHRASGTIVRLAKESAVIEVNLVEDVPSPADVHLLVPVADRDRTLWLAEKCVELRAASWRPVFWRRSRSVKPRGEGPMFAARVRTRMIAALEQSSGARLPVLYPEATVERAVLAAPEGSRLLLARDGAPLLSCDLRAPVTLAVGPEGGMERDEIDLLERGAFRPASLGDSILRFETAAIAALSVVRAALIHSHDERPFHGVHGV